MFETWSIFCHSLCSAWGEKRCPVSEPAWCLFFHLDTKYLQLRVQCTWCWSSEVLLCLSMSLLNTQNYDWVHFDFVKSCCYLCNYPSDIFSSWLLSSKGRTGKIFSQELHCTSLVWTDSLASTSLAGHIHCHEICPREIALHSFSGILNPFASTCDIGPLLSGFQEMGWRPMGFCL